MDISDNIFYKIVNKQRKANIVYENDYVCCFEDIYPNAPVHILIVPKKYINTVKGEPLYRIYVKYKTPCWFKDIDKFSTNLPIKFFIPYNKDTGLVMVSYTDGKYARYWFNILKKGEKHFEKEINKQLKLLFPSINIPKYEWMSHHFWDEGVY